MRQYHDMLKHIIENGTKKTDRTGTGTISVFGYQNRYDLEEGFPLVTTKEVNFEAIIYELAWFLRGDTNIKYLVDNGVNIWNDWPLKNYNQQRLRGLGDDEELFKKDFIYLIKTNPDFAAMWGELGPVYGSQWRKWIGPKHISSDQEPIDQIGEVIQLLKTTPDSRRMIVSAWNPADIEEMAVAGLPPCHTMFQFNTRPMSVSDRLHWVMKNGKGSVFEAFDFALAAEEKGHAFLDLYGEGSIPRYYLDLQLYQRSADVFLGVPFNIASYALLLQLVAQQVNMVPSEFVHSFGDLHLYSNHIDQANIQLLREPLPLPKVTIRKTATVDNFERNDVELSNYTTYAAIKAPVAV